MITWRWMVVSDLSSLGHMDDLINARPNNFKYISLILFHSFFCKSTMTTLIVLWIYTYITSNSTDSPLVVRFVFYMTCLTSTVSMHSHTSICVILQLIQEILTCFMIWMKSIPEHSVWGCIHCLDRAQFDWSLLRI